MTATHLPIYTRIEQRLRGDIAAGRFRDGDRLPSEAQLAREFSTTRGTVRQALTRLQYEGLIVREVGRGTFASPGKVQSTIDTRLSQSFEEQMAVQGVDVVLQLVDFGAQPAPDGVAQALRVLAGEKVFRLRRLRIVSGEAVGYEERWLASGIGRRIRPADLTRLSAIAMVEKALGSGLGRIEVFVRAAAATREVARHLGLRSGAPVLVRAHTFLDRELRPVLTGQAVYHGDRYQFSYVLGQGGGGPAIP